MDGLEKGESYYFEKDFKDLPMKNRVKLIKTAKNLLEVQKASKENDVLLVDTSLPSVKTERQRLA
jgi:hypothetical protein